MNERPLDRPVWNMLNGPQADLAIAKGAAVRIDPGYGPFAAARDAGEEAQGALAGLLDGPDDRIWVVEREAWKAPPGTRVERTALLVQMVAQAPAPMQPGDAESVVLGESDAGQMAALALATEPGPWGPKTRLYGSYFGFMEEERLLAMAGERMRPAPGLSEVSGVCTWPDQRGKGFAARLIRRVMASMTAKGEMPFLHSYASNEGAIRLYRSLGFEIRCEMTVSVLAPA